jgi:uncharacterized peroxidase-related enzyme
VSYLSYLPAGKGVRAVYAHRPEIWEPFLTFTHALMRGPGPLELVDRELIAAFVSGLNGCAYCYGAHGATAEAFGVAPELLEALIADVETAELDEARRALLRFVRKATVDPTRIAQPDVDRVLGAGWSENALHDAIAIAGRYAMVNRVCMAHGIVVDASELRAAGRRMADPDWQGPPRG